MAKNLYNKEYFKRYSHYLNRDLDEISLFAKIGGWVREEKPKKILDIGCGLGYLIAWLVEKTDANGWGIDSSKIAINQSKNLYPRINFSQGEVFKLPYGNKSFDCVLMVNLIEHLNEKKQEKALVEAKRVLKNKGALILSTPEKNSLYSRVWIHDPTHKKELSKAELLRLVEKDFRTEEIAYTNSIGRFGKTLNYFLSALLPADLVLKLKKKQD
jgi:ubiquinone/menaquinone biosynthesis C-methylase UbiE